MPFDFPTFVADWGPESLLSLVVILLLWGKLLPKPTVDRMLAGKDKQLEDQKLYYEGRIKDINSSHDERATDLRKIAEIQSITLEKAVDNSQKLIGQNDDLLELARTAAPALLAARNAAEGQHGAI